MENNFTEQTNLILSELTTVTETYDPLEVPQKIVEDVTIWIGMVAQAKLERLREIIDSIKN